MTQPTAHKVEAAIGLSITVRQLRREWGLTQQELADHANTKKAYISQIECARIQSPSFDLVCRLSDALHVSVDEFRKRLGTNS